MKIGVFDSGIGGLSVTKAIEQAMPEVEVHFKYDNEHFPYSSRPPEEIYGFVLPILKGMIKDGCEVIVIACNTVSTTLINVLRDAVAVPLVAVEPMIKPAACLTTSGVIAVCATPTTLASERYHWLKDKYASELTVIEPDCSDWSYLIETNQMDHDKISGSLQTALDADADVIVLGCTHYHWIQMDVQTIARGRAIIIQPESAVISQLQRVIAGLER